MIDFNDTVEMWDQDPLLWSIILIELSFLITSQTGSFSKIEALVHLVVPLPIIPYFYRYI